MDLQEEYINRCKVPAYFVKYPERANLVLKAKDGSQQEWNWLHVSIDLRQESNHPACFYFVLAANPVIYASTDFSHFSYHHSKTLIEEKWEWDQYEENIVKWATRYAIDYAAIPSSEALFVSWEMFLANYDSWLANFLPYRVLDWLADSLCNDNPVGRLHSIKRVEDWIAGKYERVATCWHNVRQNLDQKNYADWLVNIVNAKAR